MAEKLLDLNEEIEGLKEQVGQMLEGEEGIEILCTIPGINRWLAAILRSELGPINRFDSAKELVAYAGLDPRREESGDQEAVRSISKRGNPRIRAILYTCVRNAVQHTPPVKALYDRLTDRGKHHMLVVTACMRKLLCIAYGCWSKGEAFDPTHEKRIKAQKPDRNEASSEDDHKERPLDLNAPISRTEAQRRRTNRKRENAEPQKGASP